MAGAPPPLEVGHTPDEDFEFIERVYDEVDRNETHRGDDE